MNSFQLSAAAGFLILAAACTDPSASSESTSDINAQETEHASDDLLTSVNDRLAEFVREQNIPSLSVAIVRANGRTDFLSYGSLNRGQDEPVDEDTIYQIASLSKLLTGVITNSLIRDDLIELNTSAIRYLSPVLGTDDQAELRGITVAQLLHHQAGITDSDCSLYAQRVDGEPWLDGYSRAELIDDLQRLPELGTTAGFSYSSCGYAIIGLIDEVVTNTSYANLLEERVTDEYGMQDTVVVLDRDQSQRLATPYRKDDRQVETKPSIMGMGTPASAVYASTSDLAALQTRQIDAYRAFARDGVGSDLILSEPTVVGPAENVRFGTGIIEIGHPAGKIYLHDGDADGFAAFYAFAPEQDVGVVLLTGSGGRVFADAGMELLTTLMTSEQ